MQQKLHELLSKAIANNTLHSIDWTIAPVPDIHEPSKIHEPPNRALSTSRSKKSLSREEVAQRDARAKRFGHSASTSEASSSKRRKTADGGKKTTDGGDWQGASIVGTCEDLEKDYFRLTSAPDPRDVRPERILTAALVRLKEKWKANEVDYDWICNQLKAIRQDLTVQGLKQKSFAVNVYETHARIALENDDMNEYNQCQSQLKELHAPALVYGSSATVTATSYARRHAVEFLAYRILYYLWLATTTKKDAGFADLLPILRDMPPEAFDEDPVKHALTVYRALVVGDYATFFRCYADVPNMGSYILDRVVDTVRLDAAKKILKAYRPTTTLVALRRQLGYLASEEHEADTFITKIGFKIEDDIVLLKDSVIDPSGLWEDDVGKPSSSLL